MILRPQAYTPDEIAVVDRRIRATCHPKQADFVFDPSSYLSLLTGRGAGKTTAGLMRLLRRSISTVDANCLFIAATREAAKRLVWRDLRRLLEKLHLRAKFSEATLTVELRNGARIMLFGADDRKDVNKLRGLTYHEVVVDETASISDSILAELLDDVIGPRMIGALALIGTPGKVLAGMFFDVTRPGSDQHRPWKDRDLAEYAEWIGWSSHAWTVRDGAAHGIAEMQIFLAKALEKKLQKGWSDTNPHWLREYEGQWVGDDSTLVYAFQPYKDGRDWNVWDPERDRNGFAILPEAFTDWGFGIGVDVGFKDAMAIEVYAFAYSDPSRTLYHVFEVYRQRLYAKAIAQLLIGDALDHDAYGGIIGAIGWPVAMVGDFAGSGGALLTELSEVYGISITAADKPYKYKGNSIELTNSMLHEGQIKLLKDSGVATEMSTLQWVVDQYGKRTENKAQNNHGSDATLYLRDAIASLLPNAGALQDETRGKGQRPRDADPPPRQLEPERGDANSMYDAADGWL